MESPGAVGLEQDSESTITLIVERRFRDALAQQGPEDAGEAQAGDFVPTYPAVEQAVAVGLTRHAPA